MRRVRIVGIRRRFALASLLGDERNFVEFLPRNFGIRHNFSPPWLCRSKPRAPLIGRERSRLAGTDGRKSSTIIVILDFGLTAYSQNQLNEKDIVDAYHLEICPDLIEKRRGKRLLINRSVVSPCQ